MSERGYIIPVGGAEEKIGDVAILRRFASLCGADSARIAIIPTASELDDTGERYEALFTETRRPVRGLALPIHDAGRCASSRSCSRALDDVRRHLPHRRQPAPAQHDDRRHAEWPRRSGAGTRTACTSPARPPGAAFLCEHMIAFGKRGRVAAGQDRDAGAGPRAHQPDHHRPALPPARPARPAADGAGVQSRLPSASGWTRTPRRSSAPDETLEVVGGGALTIVDPSELEFSSMARVRKNDPVCLIGLRLHILDHGSTFNLHTRVAAAAPAIAQRV